MNIAVSGAALFALLLAFPWLNDPPPAHSVPQTGHEVPGPTHPVESPRFERRAQGTDLDDCYPHNARLMGIDGDASISCHVGADRSLTDCRMLSEAPEGEEFGYQSEACVAPLYRLAPLDGRGVPVQGGLLVLDVRFVQGRVYAR